MTNHVDNRDLPRGKHEFGEDEPGRWVRGRDLVIGDILTDPNAGHFTITRIKSDPGFGQNAICVRTRRGRDGKELESTMFTTSKVPLHAESPVR